MSGIALPPHVAAALAFQSYAPAPAIAGVDVRPLSKHRHENGTFMELARVTAGAVEGASPAFELRQVSVSTATPGRINAFHLHPRVPQQELWCVIRGLLLVWLVDCRAGSPTLDVRQRAVLSGEEPSLLRIPGGVAHGYRAGAEGATLLYLVDRQFDAADPNEGRLPWNHFGTELWEEDRG